METTRFLPVETLASGPCAEILIALFGPALAVGLAVAMLCLLDRRPVARSTEGEG